MRTTRSRRCPPARPASIIKGMYRIHAAADGKTPQLRLLGSGAILREVDRSGEVAARGLEYRRRGVECHEL